MNRIDIQSVQIHQGAIFLDQPNNQRLFILLQQMRGMVTKVAKTLNDDTLIMQAAAQAGFMHVVWMAKKFLQAIHQPSTCRLFASGYATVIDRLACHTTNRINVFRKEIAIGFCHPAHFPRTGAHVRCRHIGCGVDKTFQGKVLGKTRDDFAQFLFVIGGRIDNQATFGATKRHIGQGALVGHECRQRFYFILINERREANATLGWQKVFAMNRTPASKNPHLTTNAHRKTNLQH